MCVVRHAEFEAEAHLQCVLSHATGHWVLSRSWRAVFVVLSQDSGYVVPLGTPHTPKMDPFVACIGIAYIGIGGSQIGCIGIEAQKFFGSAESQY